jgi:mediator of RNA polymerase II transcription subunit 13
LIFVLQSSQTAFQEQHINGPELGDDELLSALNDDMDGMDQDLNDLFSTWPETGPGAQSPTGSPRRDSVSQPGSPVGMGNSGQQSPFPCNANSMVRYFELKYLT